MSDPAKTTTDSRPTAPPRPGGLQSNLLTLYACLAGSMLLFVALGQSMEETIPEGKFKTKQGVLTDIQEYDVVKLGPYPKCHPHHGEHEKVLENGTHEWVKNSKVPSGGPFLVGHPENPEWLLAATAQMREQQQAQGWFSWEALQPNLHLLALATLCVFIGSKHGVWIFTEPVASQGSGEGFSGTQMLQKDDVYLFPIMGSCVLGGLFFVLKYLGTDWVKMAITCGIVFMCIFGVGTNLDHLLAVVRSKKLRPLLTIPLVEQSVTAAELLGCCIGVAMAAGFVVSKNWILNNVFGVSFCLLGIKHIGITEYKTGVILLVGLFFYDIFWVFGSKSVFGSNVMVSVAKGVEAPIKLMFPRSVGVCGNLQHSMLGLGDIVVPGIFIAFLAKWDAARLGEQKAKSFVYLNAVMIAYFLSLVTTLAVMLLFNAAQPALLYIVPYTLLTSVMVALGRGELAELWAYAISEEEVGGTGDADQQEQPKKEK